MAFNIDDLLTGRTIVRAFYKGLERDDLMGFRDFLYPDFLFSARAFLPWGGTHCGGLRFLQEILPQLHHAFDFNRVRFESIATDGDAVAAVLQIGLRGTPDQVRSHDHWVIRARKAVTFRSEYSAPPTLINHFTETVSLLRPAVNSILFLEDELDPS
jgi:ketosteroid isomerase-like protein